MSTEKGGHHLGVIIAIIGAVTTIVTACMTGIFGLLQLQLQRAPDPPAKPVSEMQSTTVPPAQSPTLAFSFTPALALLTQSSTPSPNPTASFTPTNEPTPTQAPGLLFASQIAANGRAIDPGTTFKMDVPELYAVFPAGMTPPGVEVNASDLEEGVYYAFLKVSETSELSSVGWRWIYDGQTVNEYEIEVASGDDFWLGYHNYDEGGIFSAAPFGPGRYRIVITLNGNPSLSGDLVIEP